MGFDIMEFSREHDRDLRRQQLSHNNSPLMQRGPISRTCEASALTLTQTLNLQGRIAFRAYLRCPGAKKSMYYLKTLSQLKKKNRYYQRFIIGMIHFLYKHGENYCQFQCFILFIFQLGSFLFCFLKCLYRFLKFTFPLQELQNFGSVPHVVQYILEPTL